MRDIDSEFSTPQLCPDDNCTGQLNSEGKCSECGSLAEFAPTPDNDQPLAEPAVDIAHRELCPDGGCIGVLGADGSCKECGRVGSNVTSDPRLRGLNTSEDETGEDSDVSNDEYDDDDDDDAEADEYEDDDDDDAGDDDPGYELPADFVKRRLCPDGACIGVVANDGRCPECGSVA